ncbi:MAG: hypothetical protein V1790_12555 [Planctomycetota bacterium]
MDTIVVMKAGVTDDEVQRVGGPHVNIVAGPCAIESREILFGVGQAVKDAGASILRGGAFKPRSSPYSFSGMGKEGLELLQEAGEALDMPTITEVVDRAEWGIVNAECRRSIRTPSASAGSMYATPRGRRKQYSPGPTRGDATGS